jgi:hypothetical protein
VTGIRRVVPNVGSNREFTMSGRRSGSARFASRYCALLLPVGPRGIIGLVALSGETLAPRPASALPLYARQTGQPCATCDPAFLEQTPFGRRFKLGGYALNGGDWKGPPFAVMLQPTFANTQAAQPGGAAARGFGVMRRNRKNCRPPLLPVA